MSGRYSAIELQPHPLHTVNTGMFCHMGMLFILIYLVRVSISSKTGKQCSSIVDTMAPRRDTCMWMDVNLSQETCVKMIIILLTPG